MSSRDLQGEGMGADLVTWVGGEGKSQLSRGATGWRKDRCDRVPETLPVEQWADVSSAACALSCVPSGVRSQPYEERARGLVEGFANKRDLLFHKQNQGSECSCGQGSGALSGSGSSDELSVLLVWAQSQGHPPAWVQSPP